VVGRRCFAYQKDIHRGQKPYSWRLSATLLFYRTLPVNGATGEKRLDCFASGIDYHLNPVIKREAGAIDHEHLDAVPAFKYFGNGLFPAVHFSPSDSPF
jgi:hypothetical protein